MEWEISSGVVEPSSSKARSSPQSVHSDDLSRKPPLLKAQVLHAQHPGLCPRGHTMDLELPIPLVRNVCGECHKSLD
eukprot:1444643-Prorocentrum_lima.AAC.1